MNKYLHSLIYQCQAPGLTLLWNEYWSLQIFEILFHLLENSSVHQSCSFSASESLLLHSCWRFSLGEKKNIQKLQLERDIKPTHSSPSPELHADVQPSLLHFFVFYYSTTKKKNPQPLLAMKDRKSILQERKCRWKIIVSKCIMGNENPENSLAWGKL